MAKPRKMKVIALPVRADDERFSAAVPDPVRAHAIVGALEDLCRDLTVQFGWDQPHCLGFLYQRGRTPLGAEPQLGFDAVALEYVPLLDSIGPLMKAKRPHHIVVRLAEAMHADPEFLSAHMVPTELIAVVLATEAWMLRPRSREELKEHEPWRKERRIHEHPDRIETRLISAVDIDHVRYNIAQARGEAPEHLVAMGVGDPALKGDIANSLEYLVWVMQGRAVEDYATWWREHYDYRDPEEREADTWQRS